MKNIAILALVGLSMGLFACSKSGSGTSDKTVEQLKKEVLDAAEACDLSGYEAKIKEQENLLEDENKLKKSLQNMKRLIKC